jgi:hypothetical protein
VDLRSRALAWLPWVICAITLALLTLAVVVEAGDRLVEVDVSVVQKLGFVGIPLVGAFLAARMPAHPYGWLLSGLGLAYAVLTSVATLTNAGLLPAPVAEVIGSYALMVATVLVVFVFLLFPTGHPPTPGWRWLARVTVVLAALETVFLPLAPSLVVVPGAWATVALPDWGAVLVEVVVRGAYFALLALCVVGIASVPVRFRRAHTTERQQIKWFLLAAGATAVGFGLDLAGVSLEPPVGEAVDAVVPSLLAAAIAIAVLRYRLYDIDRIISRTVSYGLLTAGLAGLYLCVVSLLRPLLEPVTGDSSLAVAGSTLAVAAAFNPARRRLQAAVDRRFDRTHYDAARAVAAYAAQLRDQVDLDHVTEGLRDTVATTVTPTRIGLWLRHDSPAGRV